MVTLYKFKHDTPHPIAVQAEDPMYPNKDADGDTIYTNTHFTTLAEAWEALLKDRKAGLNLDTGSMLNLKTRYEKAIKETAEAAAALFLAEQNHEKWLRQQDTTTDPHE